MMDHVDIERTETIVFAVEARSPDEAEDLALSEGEEIGCSKALTKTVEVRLAAQEDAYG